MGWQKEQRESSSETSAKKVVLMVPAIIRLNLKIFFLMNKNLKKTIGELAACRT